MHFFYSQYDDLQKWWDGLKTLEPVPNVSSFSKIIMGFVKSQELEKMYEIIREYYLAHHRSKEFLRVLTYQFTQRFKTDPRLAEVREFNRTLLMVKGDDLTALQNKLYFEKLENIFNVTLINKK
jgi:hypothetical protein